MKKPAKKEVKKKKLELNFGTNCAISVVKKKELNTAKIGKPEVKFVDCLKITDMNNSVNTVFLDVKATDIQIAKAIRKIFYK